MNEEWRDIEGYEGLYQVSNLSRVRSLNYNKTGQIKELSYAKRRGYLGVTLYKNGKPKTFTVHRLVARMFIPNPNNYPQVNHKDENKINNNVSNLEWCTVLYNNCYGTRLKRVSDKNKGEGNPMYGKPSHNRKKVKCITTGEIFDSISEASKKYKCKPSHIIQNCKGEIKSCSKLSDGTKLIWEYYKEDI